MPSINSSTNLEITSVISRSKRPLVVGVGGGNDAISALALINTLKRKFAFSPKTLSVAAMLPDCLEYKDLGETAVPNLSIISSDSSRWRQEVKLNGFPEPILAANLNEFRIANLFGLHLNAGSNGLFATLAKAIEIYNFDLILAVDVGGDFIATTENYNLLSPMMDAYALQALKKLRIHMPNIPAIGAVFGLGTDGESSPADLKIALSKLDLKLQGEIEIDDLRPVAAFYDRYVKNNRRSRSFEYTQRTIYNDNSLYQNLLDFKAWLHIPQDKHSSERIEISFAHSLDPQYAGKFYLFDNFTQIKNNFSADCDNGIEWVIAAQKRVQMPHHELMTQAYHQNLPEAFSAFSSFHFGAASAKFSSDIRKLLATRTVLCAESDAAVLLTEADLEFVSDIADLDQIGVNSYIATKH